jgi:hypothetical protein
LNRLPFSDGGSFCSGRSFAADRPPPLRGDDVLGQLNGWAATISQQIADLTAGLSSANGRAILMAQEIETKNAETGDNLRQVMAAGSSALTQTIDSFRIELGKHEHAHNMARSQIEAVVSGAERKFLENQGIASRDAQALYDGFAAECVRRDAEDATLRDELRSKFAEVEGMFASVVVGRPTPLPAAETAHRGADPLQQDDAWAQAMAASRGAALGAGSVPKPGVAPPGMMTGVGPRRWGGVHSPPGMAETSGAHAPPRFYVVNRDWGDNKKLDLVTQPEAFVTWRDRAMGHLTKGRPDIRRLLLWAEKQTTIIDVMAEDKGAKDAGLMENSEDVSYVLFEGIKHVLHDNLLGRARICGVGRGLELWRKLHSEWQGAAPQVIAAKSKRFQDPAKCSNVLHLWEALPAWEQLGAEIASGGYPLPDWLMANSLEKMLPDEMLKTIVGRPELADYAPKMAWVRAQMEYAKSHARANHFAPQPRGKKDHEDIDMGNIVDDRFFSAGEDSMIANLQAECGRRAAVGDWEGMEHIANAICALSKGKGKGKGGSKGKSKGFPGGAWQTPFAASPEGGKKGGKSGGKGDPGKGGKGGTFDGTCHHCGKYGHRKNECRSLDAEMNKQRGLNNVDENGNTIEEETEGSHAGAAPGGEEDVWWMGATYSLTPERIAPHRAPPSAAVKISHRFDALRREEEEDERALRGPKPTRALRRR